MKNYVSIFDAYLCDHAEVIFFWSMGLISLLCIGPYAWNFSLFIVSFLHAYLTIRLSETLLRLVKMDRTILLMLSWLSIIVVFLAPIYFTSLFINDAIFAMQEFFKQIEPILGHRPDFTQNLFSASQLATLLGTLSEQNDITWIIFYITCFFVFSFFFTFHHQELQKVLNDSWPQSFQKSRIIAHKSIKILDDYLYGKMIHFCVLAILSECIFRFYDLPFSETIALLMGLAVFVPFVGTALATLPLLVVIYQRWEWHAIGFMAISSHAFLHLLNEAVITPMIFSKTNHIHPAIIIASILIFGHIWGTWGVFLSIPLTAIMMLWINEWVF